MNLLLTLGHNSSAILTNGGRIFCGYEEERITRVKSSSKFPHEAIKTCIATAKEAGTVDLDDGHIYVSHWYDDFGFFRNGFKHKHWDPQAIKELSETYGLSVVSLQPTFTHHDAHAYAALAFWRAHTDVESGPLHLCVADGFGNKEEVFSVYEASPSQDRVELKMRFYGYQISLGLLYQYATSFCGMKENQDEYKFLGYESHVHSILSTPQIMALQHEARMLASQYVALGQQSEASRNNTYIDIPRLTAVKDNVQTYLGLLIARILDKPLTSLLPKDLRSIVGHFVQCVIEAFYTEIVDLFGMQNVVVTGGLHYNVKLNNHIMSLIPGDFCATPLAGDQGAAIGLMAYNEGAVIGLNSLLWGHRKLQVPNARNGQEYALGQFYFSNRDDYAAFITERLMDDQIVNTVTGSMEFGPRALCNTSTLALPTEVNVTAINALNGRDTVMPMAPVMLEENAHQFFKPQSSVVGSLNYMILTLDYHTTLDRNRFRGIMHPYPKVGRKSGYSGRPQMITKENTHQPIRNILENVQGTHPALINTSLNVHGVPIVYSIQHAMTDMAYNVDMANTHGCSSPILVIGDF